MNQYVVPSRPRLPTADSKSAEDTEASPKHSFGGGFSSCRNYMGFLVRLVDKIMIWYFRHCSSGQKQNFTENLSFIFWWQQLLFSELLMKGKSVTGFCKTLICCCLYTLHAWFSCLHSCILSLGKASSVVLMRSTCRGHLIARSRHRSLDVDCSACRAVLGYFWLGDLSTTLMDYITESHIIYATIRKIKLFQRDMVLCFVHIVCIACSWTVFLIALRFIIIWTWLN